MKIFILLRKKITVLIHLPTQNVTPYTCFFLKCRCFSTIMNQSIFVKFARVVWELKSEKIEQSREAGKAFAPSTLYRRNFVFNKMTKKIE